MPKNNTFASFKYWSKDKGFGFIVIVNEITDDGIRIKHGVCFEYNQNERTLDEFFNEIKRYLNDSNICFELPRLKAYRIEIEEYFKLTRTYPQEICI